ncbi:hypothetical protein LCGC14_0537290 [marine sediment metagenome]|uniref:Uncharacterized protein n=1 Tax=marine sediment metagenome TaxID=412755 RepID=A0A0F9RYJ6_9ZZZZ
MWIVSSFTREGVPATGLSPTVVIRDVDTGVIVISSTPMSETGDGFYSYDFSGYNPLVDYTVVCDSVTLSGTERYTYASSGEYNEVLDSIESTVGVVDLRTLLIRKIQTNRLDLMDGDTDNWILYEDDEITPLLTFDVSDKDGNVIVQQPSMPSRRSGATGTVSGSLTPDIYMKKSVYDSDDDGVINAAENVSDGIYVSTASGVKYAVDNSHLSCILGTKCIDESAIGDQLVVKYNAATDGLIYGDIVVSGTVSHSELLDLDNDDHSQYILVDGTRAFTGHIRANASGTLDIGSLSLPFKDLYLTGSSLYINGDKVLYMSGNDLVLDSPSGNVVISGGVDLSNADIQHGALDGLSNDDHTQYHTDARGDARYYTETELDAGQLDDRYYTETEVDALTWTESDITDLDKYTQAEVDTISGALSTEIDSDISTHNVADNHVAHSTVSISSGGILSGGGTIDGNQTITLANADIDHGSLTGLADDDHPQYINDTEMTTISGDLVAQLHTRSHTITSTSDHTAGNWKVVYTDGSGDVQELALGSTSGDSLVTNGASAAPSWTTISGGGDGLSSLSWTAETKTADYTITTSDFNKTIRMSSADDKIFTLPSVGASEDGERITLAKTGAGKVTIQTADSDKIDSSTAGGGILCNQINEIYSNITLEYVDGNTMWIIIGARGTWSTF